MLMELIHKWDNLLNKKTITDDKTLQKIIQEKQTNDRIYDDDNKEWYIYLEEDKVKAFVSTSKNVIKNIYTTKEKYLEEILKEIKTESSITYSIVTNYYIEVYEKCGFKVDNDQNHKNFVTIYMEKEETMV